MVRAFEEACLGETTAVAEALVALEYATDPEVTATLERIVEDESRHAELGYKFVAWALARSGCSVREARRRSTVLPQRAEPAEMSAFLGRAV